ncbi:MAG TPA: hypothetical protein VF527_12210, partial [Pyrinomonadaceae bacterium]
PRGTLHRPTFTTAKFDLNLGRCKVTPVLEGSQEFALSLLKHIFDSSCLTVEVKSKVLTAGTSRLIYFRKINQHARSRV